MESTDKELYEAPAIMVVEVQSEGVLNTSDGTAGGEGVGWD